MKNLFNRDLEGLKVEEIAEKVTTCEKCRLAENRTMAVPGEGDSNADLLFIGEGPGREEDEQGRPFVGRAGKKLDDILDSVSIQRDDVFITNVVKCRPPENRSPRSDEVDTCTDYLEAQIAAINPKIIVTLGNASTRFILDTKNGITKMRGEFYDWRGNIKVFPMFHPSYLLRNPSKDRGSPKYKTWKDIKKIKEKLNS